MHFVIKKYSIFVCISSYLLEVIVEAQICHKLSTLQKPIGELLCNGFGETLNFNIEVDEDIGDIDLSKNNITNINEESFIRNLNNIKSVYLDNNSITTIGLNTFKHLPNLELLDLSLNNITSIHPEAFTSNEKLEIVDLTGNQIENLDLQTVRRLNNLKEFTLSGNPIKVCSRKTADTLSYLKNKKIKTNFLDSCSELIEDEDEDEGVDVVTEPIPIATANERFVANERLLIFVVLGVLLSLAIVMSIAVALISLRIFKRKKLNSSNSKRCRTSSGSYLLNSRFSTASEDKDGYPIQRYPQRLSTASQDRDGYLIPKKPKNNTEYVEVFENWPLVNEESSRLDRFLSITPVPNVCTDTQSEYSGSHLYEEIKEASMYERNIIYYNREN